MNKRVLISSFALMAALALATGSAMAADTYAYALPTAYDYEDALVTSTSLGIAGASNDHNVNAFTAYSSWSSSSALNVGNTLSYVDLLVLQGSAITSTGMYVGGDSSLTTDGNTNVVVDNSTLTLTGTDNSTLRIGSKSSNNALYIQNGGSLTSAGGINTTGGDGYTGNNIIVTGTGSSLGVTGADLVVVYGNSTGSLTVANGGQVTVGDATTSRKLRIRNGHDSTITVTGLGSKITVTGSMTLGESSTYSYANNLVLENSGELWINNAANVAANNILSSVYISGSTMNKVELNNGFLVVKGDQTGNSTIANLIWVWDGTASTPAYVDGTLADSDGVMEVGEYTATFYTTDSGSVYAGYTVFTGGVPEPTTMALLAIGGIGVLVRRRRK